MNRTRSCQTSSPPVAAVASAAPLILARVCVLSLYGLARFPELRFRPTEVTSHVALAHVRARVCGTPTRGGRERTVRRCYFQEAGDLLWRLFRVRWGGGFRTQERDRPHPWRSCLPDECERETETVNPRTACTRP